MRHTRRASSLQTQSLQAQHELQFRLMMKLLALGVLLLMFTSLSLRAFAQDDNISLDLPGIKIAATNSVANDQKAGSILIYPVYTSLATQPGQQNTRINMTNIDSRRSANVHLFFVDGNTCSVSDSYLCLTANQTSSFLMSDLDPGVSGYLMAVSVNAQGCPVNFNSLVGDAYVKFGIGHAANLGAIAVAALPGLEQIACGASSTTAVLSFDGTSYNWLPRTVAADSLPDRASGNDTMLIIDRIGGNLATGAATLGSIFGLVYDDAESVYSFSIAPSTCQFRASISNSFPRTTPRIETIIPAGRTGWMKLSSSSDGAIVGSTINFNPTATTAASSFNQGHNLHTLRITNAASVTIPVFPPSC